MLTITTGLDPVTKLMEQVKELTKRVEGLEKKQNDKKS